jgi:hypothetical protein
VQLSGVHDEPDLEPSFGVWKLPDQESGHWRYIFSICSVSKLFNGVAAMNLVEEGRLDLDAPFSQYDSSMAMPDKLSSGRSRPRNIISCFRSAD